MHSFQKLRTIQDRIDSGYYDKPEVIRETADRMLPLVMGGQGRTEDDLRDSGGGLVIVYTFGSIFLALLILGYYLLRD